MFVICFVNNSVKILKIRTPGKFAVITLKFEQASFTVEQCIQKMRQKYKQCRPWSDCSSRSSLIRSCTVCPSLSVWSDCTCRTYLFKNIGPLQYSCFDTAFGPRQANLVLIACASSEGSGEPAHPRSLARTSLLAHTSSESRGTFRPKARSLAPLNGWTCAVEICHDRMLEDTNSLDGAHLSHLIKGSGFSVYVDRSIR